MIRRSRYGSMTMLHTAMPIQQSAVSIDASTYLLW